MLETILAISIGIGLAAACGFRVFVPMLLLGIAARVGWVTPGEGFEWVGSWPAIITCGVATLVEVIAYYVPWLDNALDTISIPAATIAGTMISAAFITEFDPMMNWALAAIAGGGSAGVIKLGMTGIRMGSTALTGGFGNSVVATFEWIGALLMGLLAIVLPILALLFTIILVAFAIRIGYRLLRRLRQRRENAIPEAKSSL